MTIFLFDSEILMYNQDCVTVSIDIQNLIILSRDIHRSESSYVNLPEHDCPCR